MSNDLSDLFAGIRADADRVVLAPADALRRRADRRARRRALGIACAGALVLVVVAVGVSFAVRPAARRSMPPAAPSSVGTPPVGTPSAVDTPSPSSSPTPTYRACRSADLRYVSKGVGGAMGSTVDTYTMRNQSDSACQVSGSPVITFVNSQGSAVPLPAQGDINPPAPVALQPGGTASFWILRPGEGAGNITSGPTCVHNGVYPNLAIRFADGSSVSLGGNSLQVWCGEVSIGVWQAA